MIHLGAVEMTTFRAGQTAIGASAVAYYGRRNPAGNWGLAAARMLYLGAVTDDNVAQVQLFRAIGAAPDNAMGQ